jgi:hypothetical protein
MGSASVISTGEPAQAVAAPRQATVSMAFQELCEDGCLADVYVAGGGDKGYDAAFG